MTKFVKVLRYLWELPQNLLGFILFQIYSIDCYCMESPYGDARVLYSEKMKGGISLGSTGSTAKARSSRRRTSMSTATRGSRCASAGSTSL